MRPRSACFGGQRVGGLRGQGGVVEAGLPARARPRCGGRCRAPRRWGRAGRYSVAAGGSRRGRWRRGRRRSCRRRQCGRQTATASRGAAVRDSSDRCRPPVVRGTVAGVVISSTAGRVEAGGGASRRHSGHGGGRRDGRVRRRRHRGGWGGDDVVGCGCSTATVATCSRHRRGVDVGRVVVTACGRFRPGWTRLTSLDPRQRDQEVSRARSQDSGRGAIAAAVGAGVCRRAVGAAAGAHPGAGVDAAGPDDRPGRAGRGRH